MKFDKFIPILKVVFVIFLGVIIFNMLFSNKIVEGVACLARSVDVCNKGDFAQYCVKKRRVSKYKDGSIRKIDEWCDNK